LGLAVGGAGIASADDPKPSAPAKTKRGVPTGTLSTEQWLKFPTTPLQPGEIDRLINAELTKANMRPTSIISDEQFVRRVFIDMTGKLPSPAQISAFLNQKDADKKAQLIDKLLESEDFSKHWAVYWRNVFTSRLTDFRGQAVAGHFERWLRAELQKNRPWSEVVREMLVATDSIRYDDVTKNGQAFFLVSRSGVDAATELAAETSRVFLGIQIQCAQCHDHPSDIWKRQSFHEFAAYFARTKSRIIREEKKFVGLQLTSAPFGEHKMPGKDNPKTGTVINPRFLDGKAAGTKLTDAQRRASLASAITSRDNPWFAGAYVNRIWGELMGQAFCMPIDDMGPSKEAVMPEVLARVAGSFRGSDYDVKKLFREILNSQAYQRQMKPGENGEGHLLFAANNPTRLQADVLWQSLVNTLGPIGGGLGVAPKGPAGPFGRFGGLEQLFKREFSFDPSTKPEDVEGSISQALMLMNNPQINQKIQAKGENVLAKILADNANDDEALKLVYLRTLARRPSDREFQRCRDFIQKVGNRPEAFEDILWTLINSTEYQTRR